VEFSEIILFDNIPLVATLGVGCILQFLGVLYVNVWLTFSAVMYKHIRDNQTVDCTTYCLPPSASFTS